MSAARLLHSGVALVAVILCACSEVRGPRAEGDADNGRLLLRQFGCGVCHQIAGVATAGGTIGPPLDGVASRVYLAGRLPNTPENMVRWIRSPHAIDPQTTMPDLQVTQAHARDMTAYLYTLR